MALIPIVGPGFGSESVIFMIMFIDGRDKEIREMITNKLCINPVVNITSRPGYMTTELIPKKYTSGEKPSGDFSR